MKRLSDKKLNELNERAEYLRNKIKNGEKLELVVYEERHLMDEREAFLIEVFELWNLGYRTDGVFEYPVEHERVDENGKIIDSKVVYFAISENARKGV